MAILTEIGFFLGDKLFGWLISAFKKGVIVMPRRQLIVPKKVEGSEVRYVIFVINKDNRPYYDLTLTVSTAEKLEIIVTPKVGEDFRPNYPLEFGDENNTPMIDFGGLAFFNQNKDGSKWTQKIHHIEPEEKQKFEIVLKNVVQEKPFKIKQGVVFSKKAKPLTVKKETSKNQTSISIQGFNWNLKIKNSYNISLRKINFITSPNNEYAATQKIYNLFLTTNI